MVDLGQQPQVLKGVKIAKPLKVLQHEDIFS
jgi:hypothetical protein